MFICFLYSRFNYNHYALLSQCLPYLIDGHLPGMVAEPSMKTIRSDGLDKILVPAFSVSLWLASSSIGCQRHLEDIAEPMQCDTSLSFNWIISQFLTLDSCNQKLKYVEYFNTLFFKTSSNI